MVTPIGKGGGNDLSRAFLENKATQPTAPLPEIKQPTRPLPNFGSLAPMQQEQAAPQAPSGYAGMGFKTLNSTNAPNAPPAPPGFEYLVSPATGITHMTPVGMGNEELTSFLRARDFDPNAASAHLRPGGGEMTRSTYDPYTGGQRMPYTMPYVAAPAPAPPQPSQAQLMAQQINRQAGGR